MNALKQQFLEVSDALELGNPAIIEKDFWVVALLAELAKVSPEYHQMVFSGGTALAKSNVKILRMSEDVDIKLIPNQAFDELSRAKKKGVRKAWVNEIEQAIIHSERFTVETRSVRDEYRYVEFELRYPQQFSQVPCLRPIIKLELIETIPLLDVESRSIQSLVAELYQQPHEVSSFDCVSVYATLVEKIISMLRRTMSVKRNTERSDDVALVRHIYDVHCITKLTMSELNSIDGLFKAVLEEDIARFGNQHAEFVANPKQELQLGLKELEENPIFRQRFQDFVTPMVFNTEPHDFDTCFASFKRIAASLIEKI
ncbi:TPA: nucleotidyl transferase AbiEii/AbiGii toxin family protein [Vibrio vulnificus]|uniref:nucleotidyl transferase AbiEii/AbiGii toxin family protein n=1 Tax=Vibrio vulnificus TaxID=672 RepID=UPI0005F18C5F|nr:nucleotidyl transferase AbiEii/AbiGii toxin family protein [Vibrio vulnificus]ARN68088.1 Inorganic pyrophosphatase/exopolyphosphatase [Vibrio vulnificus]EGQ9830359.1 nucleotidyl transferase AbiEii/AbiGii toxin family protein [Vibrio vulnificus]EJO9867185.1 nucleotidyl transferase AbiEii/AbiGii toxin family protein [Vibrio vulnificus]EKZ9223578.1 nucleotidyl transferase AbiEii/AbiGii toxin family protein [Vibrio vulnificus]ELS0750466.1 nucleotidyl transferase AbiEii/AbiGii toxin family prote